MISGAVDGCVVNVQFLIRSAFKDTVGMGHVMTAFVDVNNIWEYETGDGSRFRPGARLSPALRIGSIAIGLVCNDACVI